MNYFMITLCEAMYDFYKRLAPKSDSIYLVKKEIWIHDNVIRKYFSHVVQDDKKIK